MDSFDPLELRALGDSGVTVSRLAVGCNGFGRSVNQATAHEIVAASLELGLIFFDTADIYGNPPGRSEELLGNALRGRRHDATVATKFGFPLASDHGAGIPVGHGARRYIQDAVESSLRRLRTDYIDLYQMHFPDSTTPIEETLRSFEDLVSKGLVRSVGVSRFTVSELRNALDRNGILSSVQDSYSLLCTIPEDGLLSEACSSDIGFIASLPLASGLLTGRDNTPDSPAAGSRLAEPAFWNWYRTVPWEKLEALRRAAVAWGRPLLELALGYLIAQRNVTSVLVGISKPEQVAMNITAAQAGLPEVLVAELRAIGRKGPAFDARVPWELKYGAG